MSAEARAALDRWIASGGHWEVVGERDGLATVALLTCDGGQEMDRVVVPMEALPTAPSRRSPQRGSGNPRN